MKDIRKSFCPNLRDTSDFCNFLNIETHKVTVPKYCNVEQFLRFFGYFSLFYIFFFEFSPLS